MTRVAGRAAGTRRPIVVRLIIGLLVFLGVTALGGGFEMILFPEGNDFLPAEWLGGLPLVDSWLIPGLVLGIGFGAGSLITAYGVSRRPRWGWLDFAERAGGPAWPWLATLLIGVGLDVWILLELIYLPARSWLEVVYGLIGAALTLLPLSPAVRDHLRR